MDGNVAKASRDVALCTGGCLLVVWAKEQTVGDSKRKRRMTSKDPHKRTSGPGKVARPAPSLSPIKSTSNFFGTAQIGLIDIQLLSKQPSESKISGRDHEK
jgi:hypothetical protein